MSNQQKKWLYLVLLSLIWGSSFILIKKALVGFSSVEVGGLRIIFAALTLFSFGLPKLKTISKVDWKWLAIAGVLSSFIPPFLFALAQTQIDSGVTAIFNSLTPLNTTLVGVFVFGALITRRQIMGVFVGLLGTFALIFAGSDFNPDQNYWYATFIFMSSLGYAFNINIIKKHLSHLGPIAITTGSFAVAFFPALLLLFFTGFFQKLTPLLFTSWEFIFVLLLAIVGTALANILFNKLIAVSSAVFAASVTYTIPLVAVFWAMIDGERMSGYQIIGACIVLVGVYMVNKKSKAPKIA